MARKNIKMERITCTFYLMLYFTIFVQIFETRADDKKLKTDGDIIFGGLFPMHEKGLSGAPCGNIKEEKGIQRMEAMMYAVDKINNDPFFLPNITIGVHVLDTCSRDTYALEQSMDFIKSKISGLDGNEYKCVDGSAPKYTPSKPVVGVIGAAASSVSIMVANILRLFKIPQISYASTSSELSDESRFGYFSRVVPPDTLQAQALADVAQALGWTYVSTLADEGNYGEKGIAAFEEEATKRGICIAKSLKIPREADMQLYNNTIVDLLDDSTAKAVVMFVNEDNCRRLLRAAKYKDARKTLHWLASDSWGTKIHPVQNQEETAVGAITILPERKVITGFDEYFTQRNLNNNARNPWFREFWESHFKCSINDTYDHNSKNCTGKEAISEGASWHEQEGLVQFVVDAVYALAHAVENYIRNVCGEVKLCPNFQPIGEEMLHYIRNVSFIGAGDTVVGFNKAGDGLGRYNVFQYQHLGPNRYEYVSIGEWTDRLNINLLKTRWENSTRAPKSLCSEPCPSGHAKKMTEACCWICIKCREYEILKDEKTCETCYEGYLPSDDKKRCEQLPALHMEWDTAWAIVPLLVACFGIIFTVFILVVFIKYNDTPIVKASARELCFVMLAGILLCFVTTFPILAKPSVGSCATLRIGVGLSLAICYAAMLTKTNRISRIFNRNAKNMMTRPEYTSPKSQLVICFCLVSVQMIGETVWTIVDSPGVIFNFPDRQTVIMRCKASEMTLVISLCYDMILIITCTVYAIKTRKIPENFNEAKYIAFTMYSTCIVWFAFVPIYFGTSSNFLIQTTALSLCTSLSAYVVLCCLFVPKLYIVLFAPHKNVRPTSLSGSLKAGGFAKSFPGSFNVLSSKDNEVTKNGGQKISAHSPTFTNFSSDLFPGTELDANYNVNDLVPRAGNDNLTVEMRSRNFSENNHSPSDTSVELSLTNSEEVGNELPLLGSFCDARETKGATSNFDLSILRNVRNNARSANEDVNVSAKPTDRPRTKSVSFSNDTYPPSYNNCVSDSPTNDVALTTFLLDSCSADLKREAKELGAVNGELNVDGQSPLFDKKEILNLHSLKESFC